MERWNHHYLGPVWIRGIYAKIVFSPKYILERKDDVFSRLILRDVTLILRGVTLILRGQTIENTANPNCKRPRLLRKYILAKILFSNTANPDRPLLHYPRRHKYLSAYIHKSLDKAFKRHFNPFKNKIADWLRRNRAYSEVHVRVLVLDKRGNTTRVVSRVPIKFYYATCALGIEYEAAPTQPKSRPLPRRHQLRHPD
jgi:hypothetical protein